MLIINLAINLLILMAMAANLYAGGILSKRYGFKYGLVNYATTLYVAYIMIN